jgi:hypothetical protein
VPVAAAATIRIPGSTATAAVVARDGSSDDAARTHAPPAGALLGAV